MKNTQDLVTIGADKYNIHASLQSQTAAIIINYIIVLSA